MQLRKMIVIHCDGTRNLSTNASFRAVSIGLLFHRRTNIVMYRIEHKTHVIFNKNVNKFYELSASS